MSENGHPGELIDSPNERAVWNRNENHAEMEGRHRDEPLNNAFTDIVDNALAGGPELVAYLLGFEELACDSGLELKATDVSASRSPQEGLTTGPASTLVCVGDDYALGIESTRMATIEKERLLREAEEIQDMACATCEPIMVVITHDYTEPIAVSAARNETPVTITWRSWFDLVQRVKSPPENIAERWAPVLRDLNKFFNAFGFQLFTEIKHDERFMQSIDDLQTRVGTEHERYKPNGQFPSELRSDRQDSQWELFFGHHPATVYWKVFALDDHREGDLDPEMSPLFAGLLARDYVFKVYACVLAQPGQHAPVAEHLNQNAEKIARRASAEDMTVIEFPLNWFSNPYSKDPQRRGKTAQYYTDEGDIRKMLRDRVSDRPLRFTARRIAFGYPIHDANDPLDATMDALDDLENTFDYDDERKQWSDTLV